MSSKSLTLSARIMSSACIEPSPLIGTTATSKGPPHARTMVCSNQVRPTAAARIPNRMRMRIRRNVMARSTGRKAYPYRRNADPLESESRRGGGGRGDRCGFSLGLCVGAQIQLALHQFLLSGQHDGFGNAPAAGVEPKHDQRIAREL